MLSREDEPQESQDTLVATIRSENEGEMNECNAEGSTTYALVLRCKIENNPQLIIVCITLYLY